MDNTKTLETIDKYWEPWFVAGVSDFIRVPNLTPMCDPNYTTNGLFQQAVELVDNYIKKLEIVGLERRIFHPEGMLPLIVYVVQPSEGQTRNIMMYGHIDKQPYEEPWEEGLGPLTPVVRDGKLYGRGGADDGYAAFSAMLAVKAAQLQGVKMPRIVLVLETEEESGSDFLISLLKVAEDYIQKPDVLICLDSGCLDYDRLWLTSSLRGVAMVNAEVKTCKCNHRAHASGVVPETFDVLRALLDKIDDADTGLVKEDLQSPIPDWKLREAEMLAVTKGRDLCDKYYMLPGVEFMHNNDLAQMYLNNTWRANLSVTGAEGMPDLAHAVDVVRGQTTVRLSCRISPIFDSDKAVEIIQKKITTDVPYNAKVTILGSSGGNGWCMKVLEDWLSESIQNAAQAFFDKQPGSYGDGGSIPFLNELGNKYPETQIIALGVGGPFSNFHAPNEMLELNYAKKLTCSLAHILAGCAH